MSADSLLLMYIIHGILVATNLVATIIIIKFVQRLSSLEFKVDFILKIYEQSFPPFIKNKKEEADNHLSTQPTGRDG